MTERWLPVVGWEDRYEVSDQGAVRSLAKSWYGRNQFGQEFLCSRAGRLLKQQYKDNRGVSYYRVHLCDSDRQRWPWVHTLILEAFVGLAPPGHECAHLDGNTRHNYLNNLTWKTTFGNYEDRVRHGTQLKQKLTAEDARTIRAAKGTCLERELAAVYGVVPGTIGKIWRGERWSWA